MRGNKMIDGKLIEGFDYDLQVWVTAGVVMSCAHPDSMTHCCNGRKYAGRRLEEIRAEVGL